MSQLQSAAGSFDETHHVEGPRLAPAEWQRAHGELLRLARSRAGLDFEEGRWLLRAYRSGVHGRLGFGSFSEYVGRLFGYGARLVQEKLRVAEALERLPAFAEALRQGQICWSAARELTRVATPQTEAAWLAAAAGSTVRELEKLVSGLAPGSQPGDLGDPQDVRHVLRFEVSGEVLACVRDALTKMRRDAGEALDDEAALLQMARSVLEGPRDEGRASYQIALTVCEHCQRGRHDGAGESTLVGPEVVEMAGCDAQHVGSLGAADGRAHDYGVAVQARTKLCWPSLFASLILCSARNASNGLSQSTIRALVAHRWKSVGGTQSWDMVGPAEAGAPGTWATRSPPLDSRCLASLPVD